MQPETRAGRHADDLVAAHDEIAELIESLTDEQWRVTGNDIRELNAKEAVRNAGVTRADVLTLLRTNQERIPPRIRAIPDAALDVVHETPAGPATVAPRLERVLIGHMKMHQGSIKAAVGRP